MYCRYCGKYLPDDSRFCNSCGKSVDSSSSSARPISSPKLAYGTLFVRRNPSVRDAAIPADIYVDEAKSGYVNNGMDCQIRLPVGKHAVKVMIRNRYIGTRYVDIPSNGKVEIVFSADDVLRMEYGQQPISYAAPTRQTRKAQKKPVYKRWWFWVLAVILALAFLGSRSDNQAGSSTQKSTTAAIKPTASPEKKTARIVTNAQESSSPPAAFICGYSEYKYAVDVADFSGSVIPAGTYVASPTISRAQNRGEVPIIWDIYIRDQDYGDDPDFTQEEPSISVGGIDGGPIEFSVSSGQYMYVIAYDMDGIPVGELEFRQK